MDGNEICCGVSLSTRMGQLLRFTSLDESPGLTLRKKKENKQIPKDYNLYDSIYITLLKQQNYRDKDQSGGCQGLGITGRAESGCGYKRGSGMALYLDCGDYTNHSIA